MLGNHYFVKNIFFLFYDIVICFISFRIPWRRFALDLAEKSHPESEDEIDDLAMKPKEPANFSKQSLFKADEDKVVAIADSSESDQDDRYAEKSNYDLQPAKNHVLSSGSDTENEIDRIARKNAQAKDIVADEKDVYDQTTDDEQKTADKSAVKVSNDRPVTPLPNFFVGKNFYLSSNLASVETIKLTKFVGVYGGKIIVNAAEADYIVSNKAKQLPLDFPGEVVKPLWVLECNDLECLLPTKRYRFE